MKDYDNDNASEPLSTKIQIGDDESNESDDDPPKFIGTMLNFQKSVNKFYR